MLPYWGEKQTVNELCAIKCGCGAYAHAVSVRMRGGQHVQDTRRDRETTRPIRERCQVRLLAAAAAQLTATATLH